MASIQIVSVHNTGSSEKRAAETGTIQTRQAEAVGRALARKRNCDLVIHPVVAAIPIRERPKGRLRR